MMPWESWNARDAAWLRIERASARTMEEEIAARWWGKKDWGEARPSHRHVHWCIRGIRTRTLYPNPNPNPNPIPYTLTLTLTLQIDRDR